MKLSLFINSLFCPYYLFAAGRGFGLNPKGKNENLSEKKNDKPERQKYDPNICGLAVLDFDNGMLIDFKSTVFSGTKPGKGSWSVGLSGTGNLMLYLQVYLTGGLRKGDYDGYIALRPMKKGGKIEKFDSYVNRSKEEGEKGKAIFTITDIDKKYVIGEFSAVLFSKNGNRVVIRNGYFNLPYR